MGTWKPLLPFGRSTVIEAAVGAARAAGLRILLVVGFRGDELAALFSADPQVLIVRNPLWDAGLALSLRRGIEAAESDELFLMNGDKPLVKPESYRLLAEEADRSASSGAAPAPLFAAYGGRAGHPVLVPRRTALGFKPRPGSGERMRDYLFGIGARLVECGDEGVLLDIDTPEEYERLRLRADVL